MTDGTALDGWALGVDLGTSSTVAMLRRPDGRTRPLLFDGRPLLPSAAYLDTTGRLHVGQDAVRLGSAEPGRLEPHPKRHIDAETVLLGGTEVPTADLLAALLGAVAREAVAETGFLPPAVLTFPASWGRLRRETLVTALARAGWPPATRLLPEPVAAARYFAEVLRRPVPVGSALAVFDFGGGTLDIAVVRNEGADAQGRPRFAVAASGGLDDLGGLDLDAALVDHLGRTLAVSEPAAWTAVTEPVTLAQWRARQQLWEDVRGAKEMLSRTAAAPVPIPGVEHAAHLTREEFEAVAGPLLRRGVAEAEAVIRAAGENPADLAGLFLVGGSSRVPLVARLLHSELGIAPTVLEQPELPVAEGAVIAVATALTAADAVVTPAVSVEATNAVTPDVDAGSAVTSEGAGAGSTVISTAEADADAEVAPVGAGVGSAASADASGTGAVVTPVEAMRPVSVPPQTDTMAHPGPVEDDPSGAADGAADPVQVGGSAFVGAGPVSPSAGAEAGREDGTEAAQASSADDSAQPVAGPSSTVAQGADASGGHEGAAPPRLLATEAMQPTAAASGSVDGGRDLGTEASRPAGGEKDLDAGNDGREVAGQGQGAEKPDGRVRDAGAAVPGAEAGAWARPSAVAGPEPQYAEPVDPWATGEAAAFGNVAGGPGMPGAQRAGAQSWLASTDPDPAAPRPGGGGPLPAYRRKGLWIVAAVTVVVLGVAATLVAFFWPGYPELDYQPLAEVQRIPPAVAIGSSFNATALRDGRAYFASADEAGALHVTAVSADSGKAVWPRPATIRETARWEAFLAVPGAVVAVSGIAPVSAQRRMVLLDPDTGLQLWTRSVADDDRVFFVGGQVVLVDQAGQQVVGLNVRTGVSDWDRKNPVNGSLTTTHVIEVTTEKDLAGPASADGVPFAAPFDDDDRIVQIGADESARVIEAGSGAVVAGPRPSVAQTDDEVVAHNGRLIVAESTDAHRLFAYDLDKLEPRVLYTPASADARLEHLTPCGADRICAVETPGYDRKKSQVVAFDAAEGGVVWRRALADVQSIVPVGEAVLATLSTSPAQVSLIDADGAVAWTREGVAARLDAGNLLRFSKALSASADDPGLTGEHVGDAPVPLGTLAGVRSSTCSWDTSHLACVAGEDLVLYRFAD